MSDNLKTGVLLVMLLAMLVFGHQVMSRLDTTPSDVRGELRNLRADIMERLETIEGRLP